jgi:two-component system phosphate regulon response regulator OmpR
VNVLVVGSEGATAERLRRAGHNVTLARGESDVRALIAGRAVDAVILGDLGSGNRNLSVCSSLRRGGVALPIVLIAGRGGVEARIEGLDAGADDCVEIDCPADELLARLRALVRRTSLPLGTASGPARPG